MGDRRRPAPATRRVDVWTSIVPADPSACMHLLTDAERDRAARYRRPEDAAAFAAGRALVRLAVGRRLGVDAADVGLDVTCLHCGAPHGKPRVVQPAGAAVDVSLSHSDGALLLALSDGNPVGADLERLRPVAVSELAPMVMTDAEMDELAAVAPQGAAAALLACWTRKEAFTKATGLGLALDMRSISVTFLPDDPPLLRSIPEEHGGPADWSFLVPALGSDLIGAVVVRVPPANVAWRLLPPS